MSDPSSMSRESKKNQLRSRMITNSMPPKTSQEDSEEIVKQARRRVRRRHVFMFLFILILITIGSITYYWYQRSYQYKESTIGWERQFERDEIGFVDYRPFGENLLRYSKDGASYIDANGKDIWIQPYEMRSPITAVSGDYAAIADQQGNHIYIFDKTGLLGTATTVLPVIKITISSKGLVAAILEGQTTSHIYYYTKDGSELRIFITGYLNGEIGYPLDISLSPDGSMLMGSFTYLQGGEVKNRVAFYNFSEVGKNAPDRFVGGFHEMYNNSMIPKVCYLDNTYSVAFADSSISFYSSIDVMSPALIKQVPVEEEIKTIFYDSKYAGIIVKSVSGENDYRMDLYSAEGNHIFSREFSFEYKRVDIDGDNIFLYNEDSCRIYNCFGNLKYEGSFDFPVSRLCSGHLPNQIIAAGAQAVKEIKLH
ncbi:MAG: hypothetical protein HFG70_00895 [Hungatella sp.]|nr:hypothetical protein [Hungatella sp.]